jgi:hypothetical protein
MARGFASIEKAGKRIDSYGKGANAIFLKLPNDGDEATVRFLEEGDEVYSYWFHDFSHVDPENGWMTKVPCLDQDEDGTPCPGCRESLPRKFQGLINIIWRDGPVFAKNDDGSIDWDNQTGTGDVNAVWRQGITVFNKVLRRKDDKFSGLTSRDFDITRQGTKWNDTSYSVDPNDPDGGKKALSAADKKLVESKYDLEKLARFVDEDTFEQIIDKKLGEASNGDGDEDDVDDVKAFLKENPLEGD